MRDNNLRVKLKRGEAVFGTMISEMESSALPIILAEAGFDFFILDMEHGAYTLPSALHILQTARLANITALVRVADGLYHLIAPVLDAGAQGIIVPRASSRPQIERSIAAMRYPPLGERGVFGGKANNDYILPKLLDYTRHANENILAIIQIESKIGIERAEELLSTPGLDAAFIGPWDLALSLGVEPTDLKVSEMALRIIDVAKRNQVASGIHLGDPAQLKTWQARGMTFLPCLTDLEMMRNSAHALIRALRE